VCAHCQTRLCACMHARVQRVERPARLVSQLTIPPSLPLSFVRSLVCAFVSARPPARPLSANGLCMCMYLRTRARTHPRQQKAESTSTVLSQLQQLEQLEARERVSLSLARARAQARCPKMCVNFEVRANVCVREADARVRGPSENGRT